jgi:hypothetical protein
MKFKRLILAAVTIIILILLMIYSAQEYYNNSPQIKKYKQVFSSSEYHNNTDITFKAQIITVNQSNHTLRVSIQEEPYNYPRVVIFTGNLTHQNLKKGDLIDVIGTLQGKNLVTATKIWVDEPWKDDLIYLRSLPAIPFVFYLFFRTWKFDFTTWRFQRRKKDA